MRRDDGAPGILLPVVESTRGLAMKTISKQCAALWASSALLCSATALAQEPAPAEPLAPETTPAPSAPAAPAANPAPTAPAVAAPTTGATAAPEPDASQGGSAEQPLAQKRFVVGLRPPIAWSVPMGSAAQGTKLSDLVVGVVPTWLDLGYMVTPHLMLGLYGELATLPDFETTRFRVGIQAQYHTVPLSWLDPWAGIAIGYESLKITETVFTGLTSEAEFSQTLKGMEFANLQGGVDFRFGSMFGVGPFVSLSLGEYFSGSASLQGVAFGSSGGIDHKALHEWLTLGVHAAVNF
jgi:hypothetical protein